MSRMCQGLRRGGFAQGPALGPEISAALGPLPREALAAMAGYGLSDGEIGRYYDIATSTITDLRRIWGIAGDP